MKNTERFTLRAQKAIEEAYGASQRLGHSYVGTEHLLIGLMREGEGLACRVMRRAGLEEPAVTELVTAAAGRGVPGPPAQGLTPKAKKSIEMACSDARHSSAVCCPASSESSFITILNPSFAKRFAIAAPIPLPEPVIIAVLLI